MVPINVIPRLVTLTTHAPAANTAAVVTLAASANKRHVIRFLVWSYSAAPTNGRLTITDGGVTKADLDITTSGPGPLILDSVFGVNSAVVVTLAAGSGVVVGKLTVGSYLGSGTAFEQSL
jgi:hypothetical protein